MSSAMHTYTATPSSESEWENGKTVVTYFSNEFPRDDLQDIFRGLSQQSKDVSQPLLASFLALSTRALKDEIEQIRPELRELIPTFETVLSWAENTELREGQLCGAVDGVLLIIAQIGAYIGYVQNHPEKRGDAASKSLSALGVGLLSSTAVALAADQSDLPLTGADAVRLAFRMGIHVQGVSETLEARDTSGKPDTWAYVVHDVQHTAAQKELDAVHAREEVAETNKIFISAVSRTSITVSGPPTRLKDVFNKCKYFRNAKSIPLPVFGGLCHAPHIYGIKDAQRIIYGGRTPLTSIAKQAIVALPVYSTSTGLPYQARLASDLVESTIMELLTQAINFDNVIGGITASVQCSMASEVVINCFGESIPLNDLTQALNNCTAKIQTSHNNLMSWITDSASSDTTPSGPAQSKLAIVGMSCRLPGGATSTDKFWEILEKKLDVSRKIPADRFDIDTHYDPTGKQLNKSMTQYMCAIDEPGLFDAPFFNVSPREAQALDPQMRLSLVTAYEALEQSGYVGNRTPSTKLERIGTYYGQAADDYREVNQGQEVGTYYIPGGCRAFGPGRINYFFKFAGPSYSIDTACSSGLAAIEIACQALWKGDVDTAVAGGVNVLTNPDGFAGLCNGHFLTKGQNACKTWCETADGYCRADGVGSIVIKRLEDADADNDNVLGMILAAGTNHSAQAISITHPHAGHQAYLSRQILRQAAVNPLDVSYIELHGTGTQAGDFEEMSGVMEVYAPLVRRRGKDQPLHIGGVKSNIGHGESAAGIAALIKVLVMLQKNAIPPHIGIKSGNINPRFPKDFSKRNLHIPFEMTEWKQNQGKRRIAAINNFGAAGGNTMMLLEEGPARPAPGADKRTTHVVSVTAKTKASLAGNISSLLAYIEANEDLRLADLAYSTTARRYQHSFRVAVSASDMSSLKKQLTAQLEKVDSLKSVGKSASPPVAFAFTGQGASNKSMNQELYRDVPTYREHLQQLDSLAVAQGFPSFIPAIDGSFEKDHAHSPVVTQLALTCTEIALANYWSSLGIQPDVVIGHSLGEYAALHVAGVITANDAIFMVGRRAQMLESKCKVGSHTMMAVRASLAQIEASAEKKPFTVACINGPADTVLSGTKDEVDNVAISLEAAGFRCIKLDVAFAFHSEQTDPILDEFEQVCKGCNFSEPKLPVISPLLGKVVFDAKPFNAKYMRRSTREAVNFVGAMDNAQSIGAISNDTVWLEMGPHPVCVGFVKSIMKPFVAAASMRRGDSNWKTIADSAASLHQAGIAINWSELHRPFETDLRLLDLPAYSFNEKNYWMQYNGDWCLTKGNTFYGEEKASTKAEVAAPATPKSEIQTSTVQQIVDVQINGAAGTVVMQSDLMQPDFLAAAHGHRMNDCGVVTSSIHADIAYTLGNFLYKKLLPKSKTAPAINMANLQVTKGLVANSNTKTQQMIQVTATTADINSGVVDLTWQTVDNEGAAHEAFATANLFIDKDPSSWLSSWEPIEHLVQSRIEALDRLAAEGKANRFSRNMAYTLFASNLVDYAEKYRGMQSVVMHELEAYADVQLSVKESGTWTVAPYYIDSVAHLAGFIMNCSDAMDTQKNYSVTPGWKSMRFAEPLKAGNKYRSYVKMIPAKDGSGWFGDVYIMRLDGTIVGMVGGIEFHSFPRILLSRFFSPPDKSAVVAAPAKAVTQAIQQTVIAAPQKPAPKPEVVTAAPPSPPLTPEPVVVADPIAVPAAAAPAATPAPAVAPAAAADSISAKALQLIANESGLEVSDLADDVAFADLGVDSLMSLVLSEKFRSELDVKVSGSLFLDFPNVGDLRNWLEEYYS